MHVGGEHVGEPADLAATHGVGLAGEGERPRAGLADAAGGEVAIDDRIALVGPLRRLVDPLRKAGDDALRTREQGEELPDIRLRQPGGGGRRGDVRRDRTGALQGPVEAGRVVENEAVVKSTCAREMDEEA